MPTIKDIAKAAGVSHGTVSNVLNKKGGVSSEKIRLVEQAAKAIGYRIDKQASLLRKGVSHTVAIILPDIESSRYADLYIGILSALEKRGYSERLFLTNDMPYKEKQAIEDAISIKVCAILTVSCLQDQKKYYQLPISQQPVVVFLDRCPPDNSSFFIFDYTLAGSIVGQHIAAYDIQKVKIFTGNLNFTENTLFKAGLLKALPELKKSNFVEVQCGETSGEEYLPFLEQHPADVFVTSNEHLAQQLMNAYHIIGQTSVPTVITLASLRTLQDNRFENLTLNYRKMGYLAANSLIDQITEQKSFTSTTLTPSGFKFYPKPASSQKHKTLRVVSLDSPSAEALKCLSPNFTRQTGIDVEIETYPLRAVYDHILSSSEPVPWDVIRLDVSSLSYLAPKICYPLNILDSNVDKKFDQFLSGLHGNYARVEDKTYTLPFDVSVQMLFYRRDLFEGIVQTRSYFEKNKKPLTVPTTYEEYNHVARFFTRLFNPESPTLYGTSIALGTPSSAASEYLPRLLSMGGYILGTNGLLRMSTPMAKAALENYIESARYANPHTKHSWGEIVDGFIQGDTAMTILFVNHASHLVQTQDSRVSGVVGFAPVPGKMPLLGGGALGICKNSQNIEQAYQYISWATGNQIASELMMMGGISPCKEAYEQCKIIETYPWLGELEKNIQIGYRKTLLSSQELCLDQRGFENQLGKLLISAVTGQKGVDETLWRAQQLIDDMESTLNRSI